MSENCIYVSRILKLRANQILPESLKACALNGSSAIATPYYVGCYHHSEEYHNLTEAPYTHLLCERHYQTT